MLLPLAAGATNEAAAGQGDDTKPTETLSWTELQQSPDLVWDGIRADDLVLIDQLNGAFIPLEDANEGGIVELPRLAVGTYRLLSPQKEIIIEVQPEGGQPLEIGQEEETGTTVLIVLAAAAFLLLVGLLVAGRRKPAALLLAAIGAGGLVLLAGEPEVADWRQCDAYSAADGRTTAIVGARTADILLRRDCKVKYVVSLLEAGEFDKAATLLRQEPDSDCHEVAHLSGFYFYRTTLDVERAKNAMVEGCGGGMTHGVLESMAVYMGSDTFSRELVALCSGRPTLTLQRTCFHGAGHATLWRSNGDIAKALTICRETRDQRGALDFIADRLRSESGVYSSGADCRSAIIMEWADRWEDVRRGGDPGTLEPSLDEPMDLCLHDGTEDELFEAQCYQSTNYRTANPVLAARRCNEKARWKAVCFATIGDNLTRFAGRIEKARVITTEHLNEHARTCRLADKPEAVEWCMEALSYAALTHARLPEATVESFCAQQETVGGCNEGFRRAVLFLRERNNET